MGNTHIYPSVTLLITHYNRSQSLERLLKSFEDLNFKFGDIVVSDDGSKPEHIEAIRNLQSRYIFRLIETPVNKGLGNNINKGQDVVKTPYTLYVQEDFVPKSAFGIHFNDALSMMDEAKDIDIVRFYAYFPYPYMTPYKKSFSEMHFKKSIWYGDHLKFHFYSDHPHLRRSNFLEKFGRYQEGISGDNTEYRMSLSFIHHHARGLFFTNYTELFDQINSSAEPSTMNRSDWRHRKNFFIRLLRAAYLRFKFLSCTLDVNYNKHLNTIKAR